MTKTPEGWLADDFTMTSSHFCYKRESTSPFVGFSTGLLQVSTREKKRAGIELRPS